MWVMVSQTSSEIKSHWRVREGMLRRWSVAWVFSRGLCVMCLSPPMPRAIALCLIYFTLGLSRAHSQRYSPKNGTEELPGVHVVSLFLKVKTESINPLRSNLVKDTRRLCYPRGDE